MPAADERDGVAVHRVFVNPRSVWSKLAAGWQTSRIMVRARARYSILHLHGFSQKSLLVVVVGLLLGKRIAIKLTSVGHDDPPAIRARGRLAYWCYRRARLFFGVSPRLQALASEGDTDFKVLHSAFYSIVQYWHLAEALVNLRHSWRHPCHATANDTCSAS